MKIARPYSSTFKSHPSPRSLIVMMSPGRSPSNRRVAFDGAVLYVWDEKSNYFTHAAGRVVDDLCDQIVKHKFKRVCLLGGSKAGYGALLWGAMLAERAPNLPIAVAAFSPQTLLWPRNENLSFPSYEALMSRASENQSIAGSLRRYGKLRDISDKRNLVSRIYYPSLSEEDSVEAERVRGKGYEVVPVPISAHNVMMPFTADLSNPETLERRVRRLVDAGSDDADLATFANEERYSELLREYQAVAGQPSLPEVAEELMRMAERSVYRGFAGFFRRFVTPERGAARPLRVGRAGTGASG